MRSRRRPLAGPVDETEHLISPRRSLDMTHRMGAAPVAPRYVTFFNLVAKRLLAAGVPLGPNGLLTVRGRKSDLPRTTPVAIIELSGRRWIWAPWGGSQWVRNLRAAGQATITVRGRKEDVRATEM